jgi:hypothetical protein
MSSARSYAGEIWRGSKKDCLSVWRTRIHAYPFASPNQAIDICQNFWEALPQLVELSIKTLVYRHRHSPSLRSSPFLLLRAASMPLSRSVTSILRSSRTGLSLSRGANPVNRVFSHDRFGARTYAAVFERNKPHVNVGE